MDLCMRFPQGDLTSEKPVSYILRVFTLCVLTLYDAVIYIPRDVIRGRSSLDLTPSALSQSDM